MKIKIIDKFTPLLKEKNYTYKIFYGGRGGGKTRNFAECLLIRAMSKKIRVLCTREIQVSIKDSVHKEIKDVIENHISNNIDVYKLWKVTNNSIRFVNGSEFIFCGLAGNMQSKKSIANIDICWVEEAQSISQQSLKILNPTIRKDGCELWFSFNRLTENDPVFEKFCVVPDEDILVCEVNYYDNPYFTKKLEKDRLRDLKAVEDGRLEQEEYDHVWLGRPKAFLKSSYYGKNIRLAEEQKRICNGVFDSTLPVHTAWDLGISDSTAIWFFQMYGMEIRLIDYYENTGEGIQFYIDELNMKDYRYGSHFAPFDIATREFGTGQTRLEVAEKLGIEFIRLPKYSVNEGIQLVRSNFHRCWFEAGKTQYGIKCLKNYRKMYNELTKSYKDKPLHDWTSHSADAYRYLIQAVFYYISPETGSYKTEQEFEEEFEQEYGKKTYANSKITGY